MDHWPFWLRCNGIHRDLPCGSKTSVNYELAPFCILFSTPPALQPQHITPCSASNVQDTCPRKKMTDQREQKRRGIYPKALVKIDLGLFLVEGFWVHVKALLVATNLCFIQRSKPLLRSQESACLIHTSERISSGQLGRSLSKIKPLRMGM